MKLNKDIHLGIADQACSLCDHIAYFWEKEHEFARGVQFLVSGLRGNDDCVIFGYEEANAKVMRTLEQEGLDVEAHRKTGRLIQITGNETGDMMLSSIGSHFQDRIDRGTKLIRLLGNIGWGHKGWPDETSILEFEAKVTDAAKQFPCVIVCMYDVKALSGRVMLKGAFETHPLTIRGNVLRENPYYVTVDEFLSRLAEDKSKKSAA
jgi:hypothetical protein